MKKFCLFLLFFCLLGVVKIRAVDNKSIYLSPPFGDYELKTTDKDTIFDLTVGNNTEESLTFDLSVVDFGSLDETGGIAFLTTNNDKNQTKYSLASWISLEKNQIVVAPKSREIVKITIINKDSLSPGGHYGAVLATVKSEQKKVGDIVGVNHSLGSLLYVQKKGGEIKKLILKNWNWQNNGLTMIKKVDLRFENSGNVHLVPRGVVEIKNTRNKVIARGIINDGSVKILPESFRKIGVEVNNLTWWRWPGKYSVEINYRYDGKADFINFKTSVWYIGIEGVLLISIMTVIMTFIWWKYRH